MKIFNIRIQGTYNDIGLLVLRVFFGLALSLGHGLGKWNKLFNEEHIRFADPIGIGETPSLVFVVFAEVFCAVLLALGLFTRLALIPLIITMFFAAFAVHLSDGFGGMEKALLYGVVFIVLLFTGAGKYSLDSVLNENKKL